MFDSVESWWQKCQAPKNKVQGLSMLNSMYFKAYTLFNIVFEKCAFLLQCGFFLCGEFLYISDTDNLDFCAHCFVGKNFNHMQSCFVTPTGSQTLNWTLDVELLTQHRLIELAEGGCLLMQFWFYFSLQLGFEFKIFSPLQFHT